jgi:hypothetical protein
MKLALTQYLSYLIAGALYYLLIAALMSVAAGFSFLGLVLLFLPLLLGGYASGLSFFAPRAAAAAAGIMAFPFLTLGVSAAFTGSAGISPVLMVAPAAAVCAISVFALLWSGPPLWLRQKPRGKVLLGILAGCPAVLSTWVLVVVLFGLSQFRSAT